MNHFIPLSLFLALGALCCSPVIGKPYQNEPKEQSDYRNFTDTAPEHVKTFYRNNHAMQTMDFVLQKKNEFLPLNRSTMDIWQAVDLFNTIIDESDPDTDLPQSYHMYQTAEALRQAGFPRWLIITGFIHDLGKILATYGEPQWAVVGDTFPVGCAYAEEVVFPEYFAANPDQQEPSYQTLYGIYTPHCGFEQLHMSWGHDEYLYQVVKNYLPSEASYIIRFHSFYAAHHEGAYTHLMNEKDQAMLPWLQLFSTYDLYSKTSEKLDMESLKPYYLELVAEFFPQPLAW